MVRPRLLPSLDLLPQAEDHPLEERLRGVLLPARLDPHLLLLDPLCLREVPMVPRLLYHDPQILHLLREQPTVTTAMTVAVLPEGWNRKENGSFIRSMIFLLRLLSKEFPRCIRVATDLEDPRILPQDRLLDLLPHRLLR